MLTLYPTDKEFAENVRSLSRNAEHYDMFVHFRPGFRIPSAPLALQAATMRVMPDARFFGYSVTDNSHFIGEDRVDMANIVKVTGRLRTWLSI